MNANRLTARERRLAARLDTPEKVQRWLLRLPYNWERDGDTMHSFRSVVSNRTAHCLEAVMFSAAILEHHGHAPLALDLSSADGLGHAVFVFRRNGRFGAVGRSRDPGLHGRKPVYRNLRSLALSYAAPFVDKTGRLTGYAAVDLDKASDADWRFSARNVWRVERALIHARHHRLSLGTDHHRRWHRKYRRFIAEHPGQGPTYFPNRDKWLWRASRDDTAFHKA